MQHNSALPQSLMLLSFVSAGLLLSVQVFSSQQPRLVSSPPTAQSPGDKSVSSRFLPFLPFPPGKPESQPSPEQSEQRWSIAVAQVLSPRGFWEAAIEQIVGSVPLVTDSPQASQQGERQTTPPKEIPARLLPQVNPFETHQSNSSPTSSANQSEHTLATISTSIVSEQGTPALRTESQSIESITANPTAQTQESIQTEQQASSQRLSGDTPNLTLVVDLSDRQLVLYNQNMPIDTYPIAVGKVGWETPIGEFTVTHKEPNPTWRNPLTGDIVPPGKSSPLGSRWIGFWSDGIHEIGFHGTNQAHSIGQAISHGCIRLHDADIQTLYPQVDIGTLVVVQP
ncbi:MAG: L,D-transpeptidase family protein [Merismopedia sp. SIO2A8]|nr:L,D-transpeptidase family protein [Merismopedia sp. SIO2A8]